MLGGIKMNEIEFHEEEKDCADMLGMSLKEYREDLKKTKIPKQEEKASSYQYDNSILNYLGLANNILKTKLKGVFNEEEGKNR